MTLKQKVYNHYLEVVNDKVSRLLQVLAGLKESSTNETKSTAGDKHETALAMLQIEQGNIRIQLKEATIQKEALEKIDPLLSASFILNGSLIKTNKGYFFLSCALGKAVIGDITVIAVSPQSPLGTQLMGLTIADVAEINNNQYVIERIL